MALDKTATLILGPVTVAQSANSTASSYIDLSTAVDFCVSGTLTFGVGATLGARIDLFADPTGTTPDFTIGAYDLPVDSADIPANASKTVSFTAQLNRSPKYVKVRVYNHDAVSITACSLYATPQTP